MKMRIIISAIFLLCIPILIFGQKGLINNGIYINIEQNTSMIFVDDMELVNKNNGEIDLDGMIQIESHITNNSTQSQLFVNHNSIGTLVLNGASHQTIEGTSSIAVENIEISTAGVQLNTNIEQSGNLFFNVGRVYLNNNNYKLLNNASISGSFSSDNMFVCNGIGELKKSFTSAGSLIFPIGEESDQIDYSPVSLTISSISTGSDPSIGVFVTDQKYFRVTSESEYLSRFWKVSGENINSVDYSAVFYYSNDDVVGDESAIFGAAFTETSTLLYDRVNAGENSFAANNQTQFADFTGTDGSTSISDIDEDYFQMYPNPANDVVNIVFADVLNQDVNFEMYNQQGMLTMKDLIQSNNLYNSNIYKFKVEDIKPGVYHIRLLSEKNVSIKKLIIN